jgi:nitroreductase
MNENSSRIFSMILSLKLRLQFTGWLQYLPTALFSLLFLLIASLAYLFGLMPVTYLFLIASGLLLVILSFDLITVKCRLRPHEPLPQRQEDMDVFDLMRVRRSCRSFQTRKLTSADFDELMEYVRLHSAEPTIGNVPIRFEYVAAPLTVWPVVNATEFLVAISPREYDRLAIIDIGRTLQKIVMDATRMGLGTCWIGPGADHSSIVRHLGVRFDALQDHIICVCAVGYKSSYIPLLVRLMNRKLYGRLPLPELFFTDPRFKQSLPVQSYPFNRFGRSYEICQWSPSSYNGQTTRCVAIVKQNDGNDIGEAHLSRFDFYAATDSRYYAPVALGIWCANWEMGCAALGIQGRFAQLSVSERGLQDMEEVPALPRYDVSWVLKESIINADDVESRIALAIL